MSRRRLALFAALAVLMLTMAGCSKEEPQVTADDQIPEDLVVTEDGDDGHGDGGDSGDGDSGPVVEFVAVDIEYAEAPETVPAGTVTFSLVNDGGIVHDVTIEELGDEVVVKADGGQTETGSVELESGSTYTYYCSVPGHRAAGMEGTLTAE